MSDFCEYEEGPFQVYDCGDEGVATFVRVCPDCGRFVKANPTIFVNEMTGLKDEPNATCYKCGPVQMPFLGFMDHSDDGALEE